MLARANRLTKSSSFKTVNSRGRKFVGAHIIARAVVTNAVCSRFGFAVSEKVGKAVVRNKVRRRLREAVRAAGANLPGSNMDVVIIARASAKDAAFKELEREVAEALGALTSGKRQGR